MRRGLIALAALAAIPLSGARSPQAIADSCTPGPYIVFFDASRSHLDDTGRKTLDAVVANANNCGADSIWLTGHIDTAERGGIDEKRVEVVRDYLTAHGIPRPYVRSVTRGSRKMRVTTGPNVSERQNRRVEIIFAPPD